MVRRALIAKNYRGPVANVWELDGSTDVSRNLRVGVRRLRRAIRRERERARVPCGIAEDDRKSSVVERPLPRPRIAECARLRERRRRAVVDASVDEKAVTGR